jgi:hypothetical protein
MRGNCKQTEYHKFKSRGSIVETDLAKKKTEEKNNLGKALKLQFQRIRLSKRKQTKKKTWMNSRIAPNLTTQFSRKRVRFGEMGFALINKQRGGKKDIKKCM